MAESLNEVFVIHEKGKLIKPIRGNNVSLYAKAIKPVYMKRGHAKNSLNHIKDRGIDISDMKVVRYVPEPTEED